MPVAIALILRYLLVAILQTVAFEVAAKGLEYLADSLRSTLVNNFGVSQSDADAILNNEVIDALALLGVTYASLKTKLPLALADKLGLKTLTAQKIALSPKAAQAAKSIPAATATTIFKGLGGKIAGIAEGFTKYVWIIFGFAATIEPGVYKPDQVNAVYRALGIPFQYPVAPPSLQPASFDVPKFRDYYTSIETANVVGIEDNFKGETVIYSRAALADLINEFYGQEVALGRTPSANTIIQKLAPALRFAQATPLAGTSSPAPVKTGTTAAASSATRSSPVVAPLSTTKEAITVSIGGTASPKQTVNYIDNPAELQSIAIGAVRAFLTSLGKDLILEIKSKTSYVDDEGQTHYGGVSQLQYGVDGEGYPKYKKYTGHFAILEIYYDIPGPGRKLLISIPLGSLNTSTYRPAQSELTALVANIAGAISVASFGGSTGGNAVIPTLPGVTATAGGATASGVGKPAASTVGPGGLVATPVVPITPTAAQLAAREKPTAVVVSLPLEGTVYRVVGDDVQGVVYKVMDGVPQPITTDTLIANTDLVFPDGSLWRAGQAKPDGKNEREAKTVSTTFVGGYWSHVYDRASWDAIHGAGSWAALPTYNQADITTVMSKTGGKLPGSGSYTLNG